MAVSLSLIAQPSRQRILRLVWEGERAAGEIAGAMKDITFGAVSQHLGILHEAGLVRMRRDGRRHLYQANREQLGPLAAALEAIWFGHLTRLKSLAEGEQRSIDAHRRKIKEN